MSNVYNYAHIKQSGAIMIAGALAFAAVLSCGLGLAYKHTYSLKTAEDFILFKNLPGANSAAYIIENDIDFGGKSYGMGCLEYFYGTINGQGCFLSNIDYQYSGSSDNFGLVCYNWGKILNLTIKDSTFHLGANDSGAVIAVSSSKWYIKDCFVINCKVDSEGEDIAAIVCAKYYG